MKALPVFAFTLLILGLTDWAAGQTDQESITVTIIGTPRSGVVAIRGETTGTTIMSKGITWELDLRKDAALRAAAELLSGQLVTVTGSLERRSGAEIKDRWIVTVTGLKSKAAESKAGASFPKQ